MMDVRQLEYFLAVVDNGGFNRAAKALYLAQPSLSQAIASLERDLGSLLFHRVGRGVVLTEAGRALVEPARQAVRSLELARASIDSVTGLRTGRVDVAAMPSLAVEPLSGIVESFTSRHPGMSVAVKSALWPRSVTEAVRTGITELGLLASPEPVAEDDLRVDELGWHRFVLVVAADGPFAPGTVVTAEKLSGHRIIAGQPGTGMRRYIDDLVAQGMDLPITVETEHRDGVLPLVLRGVGCAVLTEAWTGMAEAAGALVLQLEPAAYLHIALISRADRLTPAAAEFRTSALQE